MSDNLIVAKLAGGKFWVERKTKVLWGTYRWYDGPRFHVKIGRDNRADTVFEIGLFGRCFYIAPEPRG